MVQISRQLTMLETVDNQLKEVRKKTLNISIKVASVDLSVDTAVWFYGSWSAALSLRKTQNLLEHFRAILVSAKIKRALRGGDFGYHITDVRTYFGNNQAVWKKIPILIESRVLFLIRVV